MARSEKRNSCATGYHVLVSLVLLVAGAGTLGYGAYLLATGKYKDSYDTLASTGSVNLNVPRFDVILVAAGAALIVVSIIALISLSRNCAGVTFRVIFGLLAGVTLLVMIGVAALFFYLLSLTNKDSFRSDFQTSWQAGVLTNATDFCTFEEKFSCRGFADNDCVNCRLGTESTCTSSQLTRCPKCNNNNKDATANGCFDAISSSMRKGAIVIASVASVIALVLLIDLFVLCAL